MTGRARIRLSPAASLVALVAMIPAAALAQTTQVTGAAAPDAPRIPALSLGAGAGRMQFQGRRVTMATGAVQVGIARHLAVEFELGQWAEADARLVRFGGANLLFRAGTTRITGFAGGGLGVHFIRDRFEGPVDFAGAPTPPSVESNGPGTALGVQAIGGVDVAVTSRLHGFVALRGQIRPDPNLGLNVGMLLVLRTRSDAALTPVRREPVAGTAAARAAEGRMIRVTCLDGRRQSGRLVTLDATEVVIHRDGRDDRIPLAEVRQIDRPAHWARNLALAAGGFFGGLALAECARHCSGEGTATLTSYAAIASGAGLGIGAMINAATAGNRVIYRR